MHVCTMHVYYECCVCVQLVRRPHVCIHTCMRVYIHARMYLFIFYFEQVGVGSPRGQMLMASHVRVQEAVTCGESRYTCACACSVCVCVCVCVFLCVCVCVRVRACVCVVCVHACMYACKMNVLCRDKTHVHTCMHTHVHTYHIHTYTHTERVHSFSVQDEFACMHAYV
jgi:hypothetical protein